MAAHYTPLRVERQDLFEDQLRASNTRSVRRASGLVLARHPRIIAGSGLDLHITRPTRQPVLYRLCSPFCDSAGM